MRTVGGAFMIVPEKVIAFDQVELLHTALNKTVICSPEILVLTAYTLLDFLVEVTAFAHNAFNH